MIQGRKCIEHRQWNKLINVYVLQLLAVFYQNKTEQNTKLGRGVGGGGVLLGEGNGEGAREGLGRERARDR